jgi:hypothetical protein
VQEQTFTFAVPSNWLCLVALRKEELFAMQVKPVLEVFKPHPILHPDEHVAWAVHVLFHHLFFLQAIVKKQVEHVDLLPA